MHLLLNIDVPDIPTAVDFYVRAFGLHEGRRLFGGKVLELLGAAVPIYLLQHAEGSAPFPEAGEPRCYQRHWTPVHLDLLVDDLDVALARALEAGALQQGPARNEVWGRLVSLSDPFGHGWCLLQWQGRGYAEVAEPGESGDAGPCC
ncbi:VOC family protein [Pseudomonas borbori]